MFTLEGVNFSMRLLVLKLRRISLFLSPAILDLNIWILKLTLIILGGGGKVEPYDVKLSGKCQCSHHDITAIIKQIFDTAFSQISRFTIFLKINLIFFKCRLEKTYYPILRSKLQYKMSHYFLYIQYFISVQKRI